MPTNTELAKELREFKDQTEKELEGIKESIIAFDEAEQGDLTYAVFADFATDVIERFESAQRTFGSVIEALERLDKMVKAHMVVPDAHNPGVISKEMANV